MLKANYGIPILEDNDAADLNKYSLEMADALKTQLDKFGNPLSYKGQVDTIQDLPSDTQSGDIYSVTSENKNYIWNGTVWVEYTSTIDLTELENKTIVDKTTITGKTSQEGTPSPTNIVPIKNVNVYGVNEFNKNGSFKIAWIDTNGNITEGGNSTITDFFIKIKPNTNYIVKENVEESIVVAFYDNNKNFIKRVVSTMPYVFNENASYIKLQFVTEIFNKDIVKIEEGEGTPYTPYGYGLLDLNLQKDTDTKTVTLISKRLHEDDSVDENGFHYNNGTLVLDGTETWTIGEEQYTDGTIRYYTSTNNALISNGVQNRGTCTHFKLGLFENRSLDIEQINYFYIGNAYSSTSKNMAIQIRIESSIAPTLNEFKTYLAEQYANGTPVIIKYKLAEQENEPFDETNQEAWNTLEELLINGYTFINSSSDELQPTVTLTEYTANEIHRENVEKFKELENKYVYSIEEQAIGTYLGKTLYKKVIPNIPINFTTGDTPAYTNIALPSNIDKVFLEYADVYIESADNTLILPYLFSNGKLIRINSLNSTKIMVENPSNYEGVGTFIVRYTKTTD